MTRRRLVAIGIVLVSLPALQGNADPELSVINLGINTDGNREWLVEVVPDTSLFLDTVGGFGGSMTVELSFELAGLATFVGFEPNRLAWPRDTIGLNPFIDDLASETHVTPTTLFVALGSEFFSDGEPVETVVLETSPELPTTLSWGGHRLLDGTEFEYVSSLIAQAGQNFDGLSGSLVVGAVGPDFDLDGDVDSADRTTLARNWTGALPPGVGDKTQAQGDADGDMDVDSADSNLLLQNWTGAQQSLLGPDFDLDGDVDSADRTTLTQNWTGALLPGVGDRTQSQGDADRDMDVDSADSNLLLQSWTGALQQANAIWIEDSAGASRMSRTYSSELGHAGTFDPTVVPEPTSSAMTLLGLLYLTLCRRRS